MPGGFPTTWLEIDLFALKQNISLIQSITHRPVMPVIKANGYGHGLVNVARAVVDVGAAWLGVARLSEAVILRESGIDLPILVMGFCTSDGVPEALDYKISLTVHHPDIALSFSQQSTGSGRVLAVHAKIDSGMGRLGVFPENGLEFVRLINQCRGLHLEGLFTHLARADEPGLNTTSLQLQRFDQLVRDLESAGLRPGLVHAANSAGSLLFPGSYYDIVRPGIAIYGLNPSSEAPLPSGFRPVMNWKARLASVKVLPEGHGVSYNHRYVTTHCERIGVIPVGYADGFRRTTGNMVLVGGQRVDVVGRVCMDQCMVNLDNVPSARIGDEVVIIGRQGDQVITAEDIGSNWNTNNYEVVCGMASRIPRFYIDHS